MLLQGDLNKIIAEVNKVFETSFKRIETLEARLTAMELQSAPKKRGRPPKVAPVASEEPQAA